MSNAESKSRRSLLSDALGCGAVAAVAGVAAFTNFGTGLPAARADHYDREKVRHAIDSLEEARHEIHESERSFHGHKEEALGAIDAALHHLHVILEDEERDRR